MNITPAMLVNNLGMPHEFSKLTLAEMDFGIYENGPHLMGFILHLDSLLRSGSYLTDPVFLVIDGSYGNGKTRTACHLLEAAYHGYLKRSVSRSTEVRPYFLRASKAANKRFDSDSAESLFCEESPFLVLDDINRLAGYKGESDFLEDVIEDRFNLRLSTVVTMNVKLEAIEARLGSYLKNFIPMHFSAPDQRGR